MLSADEALERLKRGNHDFVTVRAHERDLSSERIEELYAYGQNPFAVVVSCADSRTVPEHMFMMGLGDLFVVRTARQRRGSRRACQRRTPASILASNSCLSWGIPDAVRSKPRSKDPSMRIQTATASWSRLLLRSPVPSETSAIPIVQASSMCAPGWRRSHPARSWKACAERTAFASPEPSTTPILESSISLRENGVNLKSS